MKYHVWTIGCQMNEADSRHLSSQLESIGYQSSPIADDADIVVLNTCVVRQQAEDKAVGKLQHLRRFKETRPDMTIALMGCMVGMREAPSLQRRFPYVDVFMPPSETRPLLDYLGERGLHDPDVMEETREKAIRSAIQDEDHILPAMQKGNSVTANVPVVLGCSHACSFCIIPYRRGAERSKPREEILREVRQLADQGVREVMLLGQIIDRYGIDFDTPTDLSHLLEEVAEVASLHRVRFLTSHPNYLTDRMIDTVAAHPKICPQFEIPAQSGSDSMLERMRRGYTIAEYERVIDRIRSRIPDAAIHTDIIVGFCGETEDEFMHTYRHLERLQADKVHLAKYSLRPKTIATRQMDDNISPEVKEERRIRIETMQNDLLAQKMSSLQGQTVEVLVEGRDPRRNRWRGRTPHAKLVYFESTIPDLLGQLVPVSIDWAGPFSLIGKHAATEKNV